MLTVQELKRLLHYEPATGIFTWLVRAARRIHLGDRAGTPSGFGYVQITIDGIHYYAHRLAWVYMTGVWPIETDHRNGERDDNRWKNLREVTHAINQQNQRKARSNNQVGFLGVSPREKQFRAQITIDGKNLSLGVHVTPEQAHVAYIVAKRLLHPGCTI